MEVKNARFGKGRRWSGNARLGRLIEVTHRNQVEEGNKIEWRHRTMQKNGNVGAVGVCDQIMNGQH